MSENIYARELLEKLTTKEELQILEIVWKNTLELEEKMDALMEE
ncbi:MAG: hypothetical protein ACTSW1_09115 [Candidatus Hodarchaeales archaeon]